MRTDIDKLSGREIQILGLIIQGKSTRQIAGDLNISYRTVETHRKNMVRKTGASNLYEVLAFAFRLGLLN